MLRIPKHGMVALDVQHVVGRGASAGNDEQDRDVFSFRHAALRVIPSAAVVVVLLIIVLL
jgi:hypothetical protein